jgi:ATP-dependent DNA helicase RecG
MAMSSSSFTTAASPPTGGCSPPSSGRDGSRDAPAQTGGRAVSATAGAPLPPRRAGEDAPIPRAFAGGGQPTREQLLAAPLRWPAPLRLREPLRLAPIENRRDSRSASKLADGLAALGVHDVGDLLEHLPRDRREARTIAQLQPGEQATVSVEVRSISGRAVRRRGMRGLVEATVFDDTGSLRATFFNQPWLLERYPPGTRLLLHGKADGRGRLRVSHHAPGGDPDAAGGSPASAGAPGAGEQASSVAHYPAADGVSSTRLLTLMREASAHLPDVPEPLAARVRAAEGLPRRAQALAAIHFPDGEQAPEQGLRRLAYEELLLLQLAFLLRRGQRAERLRSRPLGEPPTLTARWLRESLPFKPTADQRAAIARIGADLESATPMQRLLMGEVGSGKTVVALWAMLRAIEHGAQAALMAPTETLAEQHFATIGRLLGGQNVTTALLTGSTAAKRRADTLAKLASGELSLLVGTHALIEPDVVFRELAVAVIDEQHRFGVRQRAALEHRGEGGLPADAQAPLEAEGVSMPVAAPGAPGRAVARGGLQPHTLHMTATPIPRTLALARHGDLDRSVLRELPRGRQPIQTRIVDGEQGRAEAYALLRAQLDAGRQGYVVCPLIEQEEAGDAGVGGSGGGAIATGTGAAIAGEARAATAEFERLSTGELAGRTLALLHGQMRAREKQAAMARFASGQAEVLVATTVIEVGVDVPNATVMLVENAERFGISQLHQLRGRVGRGEHASLCLLAGPPGSARLRALASHSDGFRLAEIDLRLRKQGELIGTRQSGLGQFRFACLPEDAELLERARARAKQILAEDPTLSGPVHGMLADALTHTLGPEATAPLPA